MSPRRSGDRLPPIPDGRQTAEQRRAVAQIVAGPRAEFAGPFIPLLRSPGALIAMQRLGEYLRFESELPSRLRELAIIFTAKRWQQEYEWSFHQPLAISAGLGTEIIGAIRRGERPLTLAEDEACVYDLLGEVWSTGQAGDDAYQRAVQFLGEQGLVDLLCIAGYYTTLAMVMNVARTPSPAGAPTLRAEDPVTQASERLPATGLIGLGVMGSAMAGRLLDAGGVVRGWDTKPRAVEEFAAAGGTRTSSLPELLGTVEVVVTSLPSGEALEEVVWGAAGIAAGGVRGLVVLETSTLPVELKLRAARALTDRGIVLLDCPMSGTGAQARTGDLVAYLSGDQPDAKARVSPVLSAITRRTYDVGALGEGSKMKLIANMLVAIHNVAAAEALQLASRRGMDLELVLAAVADGAGSSRMLEVRGPLMLRREFEPATMRVDTFQKDLGLIAEFAAEGGTGYPLFEAAFSVYRQALAGGRGAQDTAAVFAVLGENLDLSPTGP